jgi:hypothetical protein
MEQQGHDRRDLEDIIGTRTRIAEVSNRKRGLSIDMIRRAIAWESLPKSDPTLAEERGVTTAHAPFRHRRRGVSGPPARSGTRPAGPVR